VHAQTFSHHAVSCAAGTATLQYIARHKLVERCAKMGAALHTRLGALRDQPHVTTIRGRGLLAGIEFAEDPSTRAPFPRSAHFAETLTRAALDAQLIVWPNVGHANGTDGDLVMLAPPYTVSDDELDQIVERLGKAITQTVKQISVRT
jgi:hypothetical protein